MSVMSPVVKQGTWMTISNVSCILVVFSVLLRDILLVVDAVLLYTGR